MPYAVIGARRRASASSASRSSSSASSTYNDYDKKVARCNMNNHGLPDDERRSPICATSGDTKKTLGFVGYGVAGARGRRGRRARGTSTARRPYQIRPEDLQDEQREAQVSVDPDRHARRWPAPSSRDTSRCRRRSMLRRLVSSLVAACCSPRAPADPTRPSARPASSVPTARSAPRCSRSASRTTAATASSQSSEKCDDGNIVDGDGCAANCQSSETCGDGVVDSPPARSATTATRTTATAARRTARRSRLRQRHRATSARSATTATPMPGDGCSANCKSTEICGNGIVDVGEECDDGSDAATAATPTAKRHRLRRRRDRQRRQRQPARGVRRRQQRRYRRRRLRDRPATRVQAQRAAATASTRRRVAHVEQCDRRATWRDRRLQHRLHRRHAAATASVNHRRRAVRRRRRLNGDNRDCTAGCMTTSAATACRTRIAGTARSATTATPSDATAARTNCTAPTCGNGIVETGEACDDGNTANERWLLHHGPPACSTLCQFEHCGDGVVEQRRGVRSTAPARRRAGCNSDCTTRDVRRRNHQPGPGEECDDGNTSDNDACRRSGRDRRDAASRTSAATARRARHRGLRRRQHEQHGRLHEHLHGCRRCGNGIKNGRRAVRRQQRQRRRRLPEQRQLGLRRAARSRQCGDGKTDKPRSTACSARTATTAPPTARRATPLGDLPRRRGGNRVIDQDDGNNMTATSGLGKATCPGKRCNASCHHQRVRRRRRGPETRGLRRPQHRERGGVSVRHADV